MEREKFLKYKETFKIDDDPAKRTVNYQKREYSVSKVLIKSVILSATATLHDIQDTEEWKYVERLLDQSQPKTIPIPEVEPGKMMPSGFTMPTAKRGDNPYFVKRNPNWMLPVYVKQPWFQGQPHATITTIRFTSSVAVSEWAFIILSVGESREMCSS